MSKNKVEFGISKLHVGTYNIGPDGTAVLGTPFHQIGSVSLSLEPEEETSEFSADNITFWEEITDNGFSGSIQVAKFDEEFKTQFLGYKSLSGGGIAKLKNIPKPLVYVAFQGEGDKESRRCILYNVSLGGISTEYTTIKKTKEPRVESIKIAVTGDNKTGIVQTVFKPDDENYDTLFTNPPTPTV